MKGKLARLLKLLDVIEAMEQTEITVELDCMIFISFLLSYLCFFSLAVSLTLLKSSGSFAPSSEV